MTNRQIRGGPRGDDPPYPPRWQVWIRVFPDHSVTAKPAETRMDLEGRSR